jgi:hypothetical protein
VLVALAAAVCAFGSVACGSDDDDGAGTPAAASTTTAGAGDSTPTTADESVAVVLAANRLVVGGNALVFGAPLSQVKAYLNRALGNPESEKDIDCDPGRLHTLQYPGLAAYVDDTGFAGWYTEDDSFATVDRVRIGSARADVEKAYPTVTVSEGSLGTEFFVPPAKDEESGLSGVFEGDAVGTLWSGATCIAR